MLRVSRRLLLFPALVLAFSITGISLGAHKAYAQQAASVGVGDTSLEVSGRTSPHAFVTIQTDNSIIGTLNADASGVFNQSFPAQSPGITTLEIFARDTAGRTSDLATLQLNLQEHFPTAVNVFLPPTISLSQNVAQLGQEIRVMGMGLPNSQVYINLDQQTIGTADVSSDGNWNFPLLALTLGLGSHQLFALNADSSGDQSFATTPLSFSVTVTPSKVVAPGFRTFSPSFLKPVPPISAPPANPTPAKPGTQLQTRLGKYPSELSVSNQVHITAYADNGVVPLLYVFLWGDGQTSTIASRAQQVTAAHTYARPGKYVGNVKITDTTGATSINIFSVNVSEPQPEPNIVWFIIPLVCLGLIFAARKRLKQLFLRLHS